MKSLRAVALALLALTPASVWAGETATLPKGAFVLDVGYIYSTLDRRWTDDRKPVPLLEEIRRYEPGGGLQGTLTAGPRAQFHIVTTQLLYGIADNWLVALGIPIVRKTTIQTNLGWTEGDYQSQLGRRYTEEDFWAWAASLGQPRPPQDWTGNQSSLADMVLASRYRFPTNDLFTPLGLAAAVQLQVALPTGHSPDPEELVAAGTTAWELHNFGDAEVHFSLDRKFMVDDAGVARFSLGTDAYYAFFRKRTFDAPRGLKNPLLLNYQPYVGDTYTIDPGDWLAGTLLLDFAPIIGPALSTFVSGNSVDTARAFPPLVSLTLSYTYIHTNQSDWKSNSELWDWDHEKYWRPGDKNALKGVLNVSLLRVGLPLQLYMSYRDQTILPGRNTRPANVLTAGGRLIAKFW